MNIFFVSKAMSPLRSDVLKNSLDHTESPDHLNSLYETELPDSQSTETNLWKTVYELTEIYWDCMHSFQSNTQSVTLDFFLTTLKRFYDFLSNPNINDRMRSEVCYKTINIYFQMRKYYPDSANTYNIIDIIVMYLKLCIKNPPTEDNIILYNGLRWIRVFSFRRYSEVKLCILNYNLLMGKVLDLLKSKVSESYFINQVLNSQVTKDPGVFQELYETIMALFQMPIFKNKPEERNELEDIIINFYLNVEGLTPPPSHCFLKSSDPGFNSWFLIDLLNTTRKLWQKTKKDKNPNIVEKCKVLEEIIAAISQPLGEIFCPEKTFASMKPGSDPKKYEQNILPVRNLSDRRAVSLCDNFKSKMTPHAVCEGYLRDLAQKLEEEKMYNHNINQCLIFDMIVCCFQIVMDIYRRENDIPMLIKTYANFVNTYLTDPNYLKSIYDYRSKDPALLEDITKKIEPYLNEPITDKNQDIADLQKAHKTMEAIYEKAMAHTTNQA